MVPKTPQLTLAIVSAFGLATLAACQQPGSAASQPQNQATVVVTKTIEATPTPTAAPDPEPKPEPAPTTVIITQAPAVTERVIVRDSQPRTNASVKRWCTNSVGVNSTTSCPFARNVQQAYWQSPSASTLYAYSPTTNKRYSMRCRGSSPRICVGGNNAVVYLY